MFNTIIICITCIAVIYIICAAIKSIYLETTSDDIAERITSIMFSDFTKEEQIELIKLIIAASRNNQER
jgi:hypothetical protein